MVLAIKVRPRSRVSELVQDPGGEWVARLKAAPIEGKANQELVGLVAKQFGCARSAVSIKAGASGRTKLVNIAGREPGDS